MAGNVSTRIEIFSNISYPKDYTHVRRFDNLQSQTSFFDSATKGWIGTNMTYTRVDNYNYSLRITNKIGDSQKFGYARLKNVFDNPNKWYYCFVDKVIYIDDNTVQLELILDIYQTYNFDIFIQKSFVERQHQPLYQADGLPVVNTVSEDIDYGSEYRIADEITLNFTPIYYLVIVSTKQLGTSTVTLVDSTVGTPTPLYYYVLPYIIGQTDKRVQVKYANTTRNIPDLRTLFKTLSNDEGIVNSIVSLYTTIYTGLSFHLAYNESTQLLDLDSQTFTGVRTEAFTAKDDTETYTIIRVADVKTFNEISLDNPINKYSGVPNYTESKLKMYPYTVICLTDSKGHVIEIKPEYVKGDKIDIHAFGSLGTQNKVGYYCFNYLESVRSAYEKTAMIDENPNNVPIVTDATADYIQGNQNSINTKLALAKRDQSIAIGSSLVNAIPALFTGPVGAGYGVASAGTSIINATRINHNTIKTIQAQKADISNIPPSASNMSGNTAYEWGNGFQFPALIIKTVTSEYAKKLTDYFNLYGYQVNELLYPVEHNRKYWNYLKLADCHVTSNMNREIMEQYKAIFENGVTLWHTDDMYNYNLVNEVI